MSAPLVQGMLVSLPRRNGIGKLVSITDGRCRIAVFYSLARIEMIDLNETEVERAYLSPQTRAYMPHGDRLLVGRVTDYLLETNGFVTYEMRFPNGKVRDISEAELYVRPWSAPDDPAEVLASQGAESQFLHDRRQAAMDPLSELIAAAQGSTSLLSAGIEFVPHQVAAVRRVLSDPIQRYLLADEVGLGKTIEAGLIIRQHLIDNFQTDVLIATPNHLCEQWRRELTEKLHLYQFDNPFEICSHSDIKHVQRTPDVLVVDEAHHLVGVNSGTLAPAAARLGELARDAPVLLLLSATPPIGDNARFLALLNLLDPQTHPLDDLVGFKVKLEQRRAIGRLLLSLDADAPGLVLRKRAEELERSFPDDPVVRALAPKLIASTRNAPNDLGDLCIALKEHIADSYRIHQRLIRSRRVDADSWAFASRGPDKGGLSHIRVESDPSEFMGALMTVVEDWRFAAVESLISKGESLLTLGLRYRSLLNAVGNGTDSLRNWLNDTKPMFNGENEILIALGDQLSGFNDNARIDTMVESTRRLLLNLQATVKAPKIVVFSTSRSIASTFNNALRETLEFATCFLLSEANLETINDANADDVVGLFAEAKGPAVLIADQSSEEGLNLSFADALVHLDLPIDSGRIEQRIGRLDRFGRRKGMIRHRIVLPSDDYGNPWSAWYDFLANGLNIFNRSISDVQFLLDTIEMQAFKTLLLSGPEALTEITSEIRTKIEDERKSQDEQYALDRIALAEQPVENLIVAMDNAEADEAALEAAFDDWFVGALNLSKQPFSWPDKDPFTLSGAKHTLIPGMPWLQQIGLDGSLPLTWKRRVAARQSNTNLLRPGTPLIDALTRFTRWDDRGTAFVTYRSVSNWQGDVWIGFKLCFSVEPNIIVEDLLAPSREEFAASRRAQHYLPQSTHTMYIDVNGDPVTDPNLLATLAEPYDGQGSNSSTDTNLSSRPDVLARFIDQSSFQIVCRKVRDVARQMLMDQPELLQAIHSATKRATADLQRRENRLQRRKSAGDAMAWEDIALIKSILPSIANPAIRLDAMGCFVLGGRLLDQDHHG